MPAPDYRRYDPPAPDGDVFEITLPMRRSEATPPRFLTPAPNDILDNLAPAPIRARLRELEAEVARLREAEELWAPLAALRTKLSEVTAECTRAGVKHCRVAAVLAELEPWLHMNPQE